MTSLKDNIKQIRDKLEKDSDKNNIKNKIKNEIGNYKNANLSQNQLLEQLAEKKAEMEQKKENDIAKMYEIAITILKDLWAKKMSEAEQKKLQIIIEKTGIEMQKYQLKNNIEKQHYIAQKLIENLKTRADLLENAKKIAEENISMLQFCKGEFGNVGKNIINQFNFENKGINTEFMKK